MDSKYFLWCRRGLAYRGAVSCLAGRVRCQSKNLADEEAESVKILRHLPNRIHLAPSSWATFEAEGFTVLSFVPQVAGPDLNAEELPSYHRNIDMDEIIPNHADEDPSGRPPGLFRHTPQGILHGAPEACRAEFQQHRPPGQRRTGASVGVDTYKPLIPTPEFAKMAG